MVGNTASYTTPQLHSCTIQLNNCSHTASCTVAQYTQFHICTVPQLHSFLHGSTVAPFHSFQHSYVAASQATDAAPPAAVMQDSDSENKSHRRSFPNLATCKHLVDPHRTWPRMFGFQQEGLTFKNLNQHTATLSNLCTDVANAASICL